MSFKKGFIGFAICLFLAIGIAGKFKNKETENSKVDSKEVVAAEKIEEKLEVNKEAILVEDSSEPVDRVRYFFSKGNMKLPIVQTIKYTSRVPWLKGRPAWVSDYASYFETSRHFIARGLNGREDYITQKVSLGDQFNVYRQDSEIEFYLLVDLKSKSMDFYYLDQTKDERVFIKSYKVGLGREDKSSPSGYLTPTGKFKLGQKVAIYKPGMEHFFQNQKREMIQIFGTRWLPFEEEIENCSDAAKGYGIHGVPCHFDVEKDEMKEEERGVDSYSSDGCIRLRKKDVEELFAIIITKPSFIEIVKNKSNHLLPMSKENRLEELK